MTATVFGGSIKNAVNFGYELSYYLHLGSYSIPLPTKVRLFLDLINLVLHGNGYEGSAYPQHV